MTGQHVGYIRVSSTDQNLERQLVDIQLDEVFKDKISGKDTKRPGLEDCLRHCRKGDTLHVHSMDRLARNLKDLKEIVDGLTEKQVQVKFHKENMTFGDDSNPMNRFTMHIMGAFAEFERDIIRARQQEGIDAAIKRGVRFGANPKLKPEQEQEMVTRALQPGASKKDIAAEYGVSRQTLYKVIERVKNK